MTIFSESVGGHSVKQLRWSWVTQEEIIMDLTSRIMGSLYGVDYKPVNTVKIGCRKGGRLLFELEEIEC